MLQDESISSYMVGSTRYDPIRDAYIPEQGPSGNGGSHPPGGNGGGSTGSVANDKCKTDKLWWHLITTSQETLGKAGIKETANNNPTMTKLALEVKKHHPELWQKIDGTYYSLGSRTNTWEFKNNLEDKKCNCPSIDEILD